ncbi:ROK family protein [Streptomyces sp. 3MP-14]|uniref:ROK family protein n=1 Tax=Streptomyces mimosae TaxID=2586635 RepID=A0A5N5ZT19_9ACTN|nr:MULTISPECIES: ROK family protein [Streptomyces]KAB8158876.1 ROK family protein [Streptomyces mimosae]KAB8174884.1 ROK family protein [Streptomyces sp. 3MP-14]
MKGTNVSLPGDLAEALRSCGLAARRGVHVVEVGGSSVQSTMLGPDGGVQFLDGPQAGADGEVFGLTAPGLVIDGRVWGATQLGWDDVAAWRELGYRRPPDVSMNDAEAAALGEWLLREERPSSLLYAGIGTGLGGALVVDGVTVPSFDLSHRTGFGDGVCHGCRRRGCLNAQVGGEYLPARLSTADGRRVVELLATAIEGAGVPAGTVVVFAGGLVRRTRPELVAALRERLRGVFPVVGSAAPEAAKSAAYAGVFLRLAEARRPTTDRDHPASSSSTARPE